MPETWYVLDDGDVADPSEVAPDENGTLRHKDGRAIKARDDLLQPVPSTRSVDPELESAKRKTREMKPAAQGGEYKTRDTEAG